MYLTGIQLLHYLYKAVKPDNKLMETTYFMK